MNTLKAWAMAAVVLLSSIATALEDGTISLPEIIFIATAVLTSAGVVWYVENSKAAYAKAVVATALGALSALAVAAEDQVINAQEITTTLAAALAALIAVYATPNEPPPVIEGT